MFDNEELDLMSENTEEETAEETIAEPEEGKQEGQFYTDEEINRRVNELTDRRVARMMRKYERDMAKYKDTENVLRSQIGGENIDEVNRNLRDLYTKDGVELPAVYQSENTRDAEVLAKADAEDFINDGFDAMEEEAERLAQIGYENLSQRDKVVFQTLVEKINDIKDEKELLSIGASKDILSDKDFVAFRNKFKRDTPIKDIYDTYTEKHEKIETPGSLTNGSSSNEKLSYTDAEIAKLSLEDLDDDKVWEAVRRSMTGQ